jgi:5-methylcytosine-specific restriction enzyme A
MPLRPPLHQGAGFRSTVERRRDDDSRRGSARQRGYTTAWQKARAAYLAQHPLCLFCEREGEVTAAVVVDHLKAHQGDYGKFWDQNNWQSLCKRHHDGAKQREEKSRPMAAGWSKGNDPALRTGPLGKFLRPRNWTGGSND